MARVELSCATLRVRSASGVGHPIVFLIDPPNTVEHYDALIQILAQRGRVLCVELPGFGFSTPGAGFDHGARFALGSLCQAWFRGGLPELVSVPQSARLIWGNADRSHRRSRAHSLREFLPNAECLTFETCGHFPELEAPQRFAEVLSSLLDPIA